MQKGSGKIASRAEKHKESYNYLSLNSNGTVTFKQRQTRLKNFGALFSCFTTRVIYLEEAESFDSDSVIDSLQRFFNTRGKPGDVYIDCGTNLKGNKIELKNEIDSMDIYLTKKPLGISSHQMLHI